MWKLGRLIYLNSAPVYYGIDSGLVNLDAELVPGLPSQLNQWLAEGKLNLSPISAIEYARHQEQYLLLPNLCLNSDGMVKSVLLISKSRIEELDGKKVALTTSSATSQALVRIILSEKYKAKITYTQMAPDLEKMLESHEAALIIGDDALDRDFPAGLKIYDLGQLWKDYCGFPVVFVTFAVRKEFVTANKKRFPEISELLQESLMQGLANLDQFAKYEQYKEIASRISMQDYFANLHYSFDDEKKEALLFYYKMAAKLGLSPECKKLHTTSFQKAEKPSITL